MPAAELSVLSTMAIVYNEAKGDLTFAQVMGRCSRMSSEAELADLIDADGRYRIGRRLPVDLERYLEAVPDLPQRSLPLDAAIDMAFRAFARTSRVEEPLIQEMITRHPHLAGPIREAAVLNRAVWTTTQVHDHLQPAAAPRIRALPCPFGPPMPRGQEPRYQLTQLLGEGGFGQVYLAIDHQLSEKDHQALVSIKVLSDRSRTPWSRQRLTDEATKARRVSHGNVVRIIDRGISGDDEDFIVYEFVDGGDLSKWARRHGGAQDPLTAARLAAHIARGVHAAHMAGLVHCDLKPANIVMTSAAEPKVADFGIAIRPEDRKSTGESSGRPMRPIEARLGGASSPAVHGSPIGNLAFMSPEQFHLEPGALTIPTDVYALAGILYWLITGDLPNGRTPDEVRRTHDGTAGADGRRGPPDLAARRPGVDRDLAAICAKGMAYHPSDRHSSAAAFADDLEAWLRLEPIAWTRPTPWRRARLWTRRKPTAAVMTAVVALVVVASSIALERMASVMRQRDFEAAMTQARIEARAAAAAALLDDEQQARESFSEALKRFRTGLRVASETRSLSTDLLPRIWLAEWLFGRTILKETPDAIDFWNARIEIVRQLLNRASANGQNHAIHTLLWESALAFWLVNRGGPGDYAESEALSAACLGKWQGLLTRDDPWLGIVQAVHASAFVRRLAEQPESDRSEQDVARLAQAADLLEQAAEDQEADTPSRAQAAESLEILYGPRLLNQPQRVRPAGELAEASTLAPGDSRSGSSASLP